MARVGRIAILTLICCGVPFTANRAFAAAFEITHWTDYVRMNVPGTLGESITFDWSVYNVSDGGVSGLPGVADGTPFTMSGIADLGPLMSLDAEWYPDGSIGSADYVFGKGTFVVDLMFDLLDGTSHTMSIRGGISPVFISVSDVCCGYPMASSNDIILSLLHAKVDPKSAALFGMKRQITGSAYYHTDVYNMDSPDREFALFGRVFFDYTPVKHTKSADLTAVPEPGVLALIGLGVAATIRRKPARHRSARD